MLWRSVKWGKKGRRMRRRGSEGSKQEEESIYNSKKWRKNALYYMGESNVLPKYIIGTKFISQLH